MSVAPRRLSRHTLQYAVPSNRSRSHAFTTKQMATTQSFCRTRCTPTLAHCLASNPPQAARALETWLQAVAAWDTHTRTAPTPGHHSLDTACAVPAGASACTTAATHWPPGHRLAARTPRPDAGQTLGARSGRQTTIARSEERLGLGWDAVGRDAVGWGTVGWDDGRLEGPQPTWSSVAWASW